MVLRAALVFVFAPKGKNSTFFIIFYLLSFIFLWYTEFIVPNLSGRGGNNRFVWQPAMRKE